MKKTLSLTLAFLMIFVLAVSCFAETISVGGTKSPTPIVPEVHRVWEYDTETDKWVEVDADGYLKLVVTPYEKRYTPNTNVEGVPPYILEHLEDAYKYRDECIPLASDYTGIPEEKLAIASIFDITWEDLPKDIHGIRIELTGFNEENFVCLLHKNHVDAYHQLGEDWFVETSAYMRGEYLYIDTPHLSSFAVIVHNDVKPDHSHGTSTIDIEGRETVSPVTGADTVRPLLCAGCLFAVLSFAAVSTGRKNDR